MEGRRLSRSHLAILAVIRNHGEWISTYKLGFKTPQYTGETAAKKARDLRRWGYLDWRKVPDLRSGGCFVEYKPASIPGEGREATDRTPDPRLSASPTVADAPAGGQGTMFDMDRVDVPKGKGTR